MPTGLCFHAYQIACAALWIKLLTAVSKVCKEGSVPADALCRCTLLLQATHATHPCRQTPPCPRMLQQIQSV
jgi:hypothetical protein